MRILGSTGGDRLAVRHNQIVSVEGIDSLVKNYPVDIQVKPAMAQVTSVLEMVFGMDVLVSPVSLFLLFQLSCFQIVLSYSVMHCMQYK